MKRVLAEGIVTFLSFSNQNSQASPAIEKFTRHDWNCVRRWMDDSGLAFYFLQRLIDRNATRLVPAWFLSRLQRNFSSNQARVDDMSTRFQSINKGFDEAGVRYAVVKGFSLVPEFCPDAALRHQADLDYLIDPQSLPAAQRVLVGAGYEPKDSISTKESTFISPGAKASRNDLQYSPAAGHAVELHTDIWDGEMYGLQQIPQLFQVDRAGMHHWNGPAFFALSDVDTFLLEILHACHHLFGHWIRMSCLFEIGYFLNRHASDAGLWSKVERRVQDNAVVRELVVVVAQLVQQLFAPSLPPLIFDWATRVRPPIRVWIENYARSWAFCELPVHEFTLFPGSKLVLFLQQQFTNERIASAFDPHNPAKQAPLSNLAQLARRKPLWLPHAGWLKRKHLLHRSIYYVLAQARYFCEIPRWHWLNRTTTSALASRHLRVSNKAS